MTATLIAPSSSAEQNILNTLSAAGFREASDGWHYPPGGPDRAAVRLAVFGGQYQLARRRSLKSPWLMIATDDAEHFDPQAFEIWRVAWPLVH